MILKSILRSAALTFKNIFLTESVVASVIIGNSLLLFIMGYDEVHNEPILHFIDHTFTIFFVIEVLVKVREKSWSGYISDAGNKFDFILVAISLPSILEIFITLPDVSYLLVFRLLRVRFVIMLTKVLDIFYRYFKTFIFAALLQKHDQTTKRNY